MKINRRLFERSIIAQDDDHDYQESGFAICLFPDGTAAIFDYSHCSCYGTWEAMTGGGISDYYDSGEENPPDREVNPVWNGTKDQLIAIAKGLRDPSMPERLINSEDYDYDHLMNCYQQVLKHFNITKIEHTGPAFILDKNSGATQ